MIINAKDSKQTFIVNKPLSDIDKIAQMMKLVGEEFVLQAGRKLNYYDISNSRYIYSFESGIFTVIHQDSDACLSQGISPCIYGLAELHHPVGCYSLVADSLCTGWRVKNNIMISELTSHRLWKNVSSVLSYRVYQLLSRESHLVGVNSYAIICYQLNNLMKYPDEIRCKINIQRFICQHTALSRSGVLSILSSLKKGGYIVTDNGSLVSITLLPDSF